MLGWWYTVIASEPVKTRETLSSSSFWVDVRDVADAHVLALEKEAAGNERVIITAGPFVWQELGERSLSTTYFGSRNITLAGTHTR